MERIQLTTYKYKCVKCAATFPKKRQRDMHQTTYCKVRGDYTTTQKIRYVITRTVGEHATQIASYVNQNPKTSDFTIAKSLRKRVKDVRTTLYQLQEHNLVNYYKKKDYTKGWYISYWTLNTNTIKSLLQKISKQKKPKQIKTEYQCPNKCINATTINAMENGYQCYHCGKILQNKTEG